MSKFKELAEDFLHFSGWFALGFIIFFAGVVFFVSARLTASATPDSITLGQSIGGWIVCSGLTIMVTSGLRSRTDNDIIHHRELMRELKDIRAELAELKRLALIRTDSQGSISAFSPGLSAEKPPELTGALHTSYEVKKQGK